MSSWVSTMPRQGVNARQAETVARLIDAAALELREHGGGAVSVRSVAQRAGVSSGTAYTYFSSKGHLFAELFLRHLGTADDAPRSAVADPVARVQAVTDGIIAKLLEVPELADVVTPALLGTDPDVARLRLLIGGEFYGRFERAIGDGGDPELLVALNYGLLGGLLSAGMGLVTYAELAGQARSMVATIMRGNV
jgi:AcrR family transcriptional regulator